MRLRRHHDLSPSILSLVQRCVLGHVLTIIDHWPWCKLYNLDLCDSPGNTPSRRSSNNTQSRYEVASEQPDRGRSLHPADAHLRSISIQRGLNGHIQGRQKSPVSAGRNRKGSAAERLKRVCRSFKRLGEDCSFCNVCAVLLCKGCWDLQITHSEDTKDSEDTKAAGNVPHEKTDPDIAEKVKACLEPSMTDEQQMFLHRCDENTTCFGVGKDEMEELIFENCGRYARIIADCSSGRRSSQYPALVSFVSQTSQPSMKLFSRPHLSVI